MEAQALSVQPRGQIQRRSQLQRMSQLQRRLHFQGLILLLQRYKLLLQSGGVASWTLAATEAPPTIPRPNRVAQVLLPPCLRLEPQNFPNGFSLSLSVASHSSRMESCYRRVVRRSASQSAPARRRGRLCCCARACATSPGGTRRRCPPPRWRWR